MADNIQVVVRTRPLLEREIKSGGQQMWKTQNGNTIQSTALTAKQYSFMFDAVFDDKKTTSDVYRKIDPIIVAAMNGFNGTIFAYGQTASGKTHTMMGNPSEPGIIPRAVQQIYEHIESVWDREFLIRVSYMELYNENVVDLLGDGKTHLDIREDQAGNVFVDKLEEAVVASQEEIMNLITRGEDKRHFGVTNMNERSSRSHTIFKVIIESKEIDDKENNHIIVSALNLVDLAGSEKAKQTGAVGQRLQEGGYINKSLSALSKVISQLSDTSGHARHVSYRDSKLTRILQNSLGGNSKTAIISNCTPASYDETLSTLRFAMSAKRITNKPVVNEVLSNEAMIMRYKEEIGRLQKQLTQMKSTDVVCVQEEKKELQQRLQEEEQKRLDQQDQIERLTNLICVSSHLKPTGMTPDFKMKSKRRETWCPGGRNKGLKTLSLSPVIDTEPLNSTRFQDRLSDLPPKRFGFSGIISEEDESLELESELQTLKDQLLSTQEKLRQTQQQVTRLLKENELKDHDIADAKIALQELQEFTEVERELKNLSIAEKLGNTSWRSEEMENLQAVLDRDRKDAENMMQDLQKQLALEKDHSALLKAEMDELNKTMKKLEAERGDFDILMEMEKAKFKRRESELKDQLERAYAEGGKPAGIAAARNLQQTAELESTVEELRMKIQEMESELDQLKNSEAPPNQKEIIEQLNQKVTSLQEELAQKTQPQTVDCDVQTDQLGKSNDGETQTEPQNKDESEDSTPEKAEQLSRIQDLSNEVTSLNAELVAVREVATNNELNEKQIEELKQEIDSLKSQRTEKAEEPQNENFQDQIVENLTQEITRLKKELEKKTAVIQENEGQQERIEQLSEQVQSLRAQLALSEEMAAGPAPMSLADELDDLTVGLSGMFPRKSLARSPLKSQESDLESEAMDELKRDLEYSNNQLKDSNNELKQQLSKIQEELTKANEELSDAENILTLKESELAEIEERENKLKIQHENKVSELESEIQELLCAMQETRAKEEEHLVEKKEMKDLIDSLMNDRDNQADKSSEKQQLIESLNAEKEELLKQIDELRQIVESFAKEKEELVAQNTKMREQVDNVSQNDEALHSTNFELMEKVANLQKQLDQNLQNEESIEAKTEEYQEIINRHLEKESTLVEQISELENLIEKYSENEKELRTQEEELQSMLDTKEKKVEELMNQNNQFFDKLQEVEQEKSEMVAKISQLQVLFEGLNSNEEESLKRQRELQQEVEALKQNLNDKEHECFTRITALSNDLDELQSENIDLVAAQQKLSEQVNNLQAEKEESVVLVTKLHQEVEEQERKVAETLVERDLARDELERVKSMADKTSDKNEQVSLLNEQVTRLSEESCKQSQVIENLRKEQAESTEALAAAEEKVKSYEVMIEKGKQMLQRSQEDYDEISEQCNEFSELNQQLSTEREELAQDLERLREQHESNLHELEAFHKEEKDELEKDKERLENEVTAQSTRVTRVEEELETVQCELSNCRAELAAYQSCATGDKEELQTLRDKLSATNEQIASLQDELVQQEREAQQQLEQAWQDLHAVQQQYIQAQEDMERMVKLPEYVNTYLAAGHRAEAVYQQQLQELRDQYEQKYKQLLIFEANIQDSDSEETNRALSGRLQTLVHSISEQSLQIASEVQLLRQRISDGERTLQEEKERAEAEEERLMKCCDESDAELEDMTRQRNELRQQLNKMNSKHNTSISNETMMSLQGKINELAAENETLRKKIGQLESDIAEQKEAYEAEEQRLMTCCDESDAELEDMRKQRNQFKAQLDKMNKESSDSKSLRSEKDRLDRVNREQQIELVKLKNEVLMASDPYRERIRLLTKEIESWKEREQHLKNELRKTRNNNPDDSIMSSRSCSINGPSGVNAELMRCQLDMEKRRHEKETKLIKQENESLKIGEKKLRDEVKVLKRQVQEKEMKIQKFKDIYNKKLTSDDRHVLRDIANSPAPSLGSRIRTPRGENAPPRTPLLLKQRKTHKSNEGSNLHYSPNLNRTVCDDDYRVCDPPDPSADIQCPQQ